MFQLEPWCNGKCTCSKHVEPTSLVCAACLIPFLLFLSVPCPICLIIYIQCFYFFEQAPKMVVKKSRVSEQEQLASKLDKALSLTKLSKLSKSSCKFIEGSSGKSRASSGSRVPMLTDLDMRVKMGKSSLSKDLSTFHKSSKGGKSKMAAKTKLSDPCLKEKGQRKAPYSPMRSEISSFSNSKSRFL